MGASCDESDQLEEAVTEYCRAIALAGDGGGARDARTRLGAIAAAERTALPEEALVAFEKGLAAVDRDAYAEAVRAFRRRGTKHRSGRRPPTTMGLRSTGSAGMRRPHRLSCATSNCVRVRPTRSPSPSGSVSSRAWPLGRARVPAPP